MTQRITSSAGIPVSTACPVVTYSPITLHVTGRAVELQLKVSMPATGTDLPLIVFSHGHGRSTFISSLDGYGPLVNFWAAHGFVVIQPTHLDSGTLGLREAADPDAPLYWRSRADDMRVILDRLDEIEREVPGLAGRIDRDRVGVAGHSLGGLTGCMLLGARLGNPDDGSEVDLSDHRYVAGVVMAPPGDGRDLNPFASEHYPVLRHTNFATMTSPTLVVAGDEDRNEMFSDRASYRSDAYHLGPGPKSLLTVFGGEHQLGGVSGYDAVETTDENPERVAAVRAIAWAYLRSRLYADDRAWADAASALAADSGPMGQIESK